MVQTMCSDHVNSGMIEVSGFSCSSIKLLHVVYARSPARSQNSDWRRLGEQLEVPVYFLGLVMMCIF